eukprot:9689950-Ditylum_brightwellii.AAC.1
MASCIEHDGYGVTIIPFRSHHAKEEGLEEECWRGHGIHCHRKAVSHLNYWNSEASVGVRLGEDT